MMSTPIAAAVLPGVDATEGSPAATQPIVAGPSGFASTLDALFADAAASAPATTPSTAPGVSAAAPDESLPVNEEAAEFEAGAVAIDPLLLLGLPVASQLTASVPPSGPLHWLRPTLDRAVAATPAGVAAGSAEALLEIDATRGELPVAALPVGGLSEQTTAAAPLVGANGVDPSLAQAAASVVAGTESPATDLATLDAPKVDGAHAMQGADHAATHKPAHEPAARALPPPVTVPMQSPDWSREFAARVSWMVERGEQFASIRLTPEQLGPVEVRLAIREGEASIWFGAAQADTRAAIEQALPRLREMLAASGLALADSGVFQGSPRDPRHGLVRADARRAAGETAEPAQELRLHYRRLGLIDDYA